MGLQQTGFNWKEFGKNAYKVMVDIDDEELHKGHPNVNLPIKHDASSFLKNSLNQILNLKIVMIG